MSYDFIQMLFEKFLAPRTHMFMCVVISSKLPGMLKTSLFSWTYPCMLVLKQKAMTYYSAIPLGPYSFLSFNFFFYPASPYIDPVTSLITSSFTFFRFHFIATTTRFSNLKYCNSLWTALPASRMLPAHPSFVVLKNMFFLLTGYVYSQCWDSTLHQP